MNSNFQKNGTDDFYKNGASNFIEKLVSYEQKTIFTLKVNFVQARETGSPLAACCTVVLQSSVQLYGDWRISIFS